MDADFMPKWDNVGDVWPASAIKANEIIAKSPDT